MATAHAPLAETREQRSYLAAFDALDHEWRGLCRRHRRDETLAHWSRVEPALEGLRTLADVIPEGKADRTPTFQALVAVTRSGDALAARVLLQLMIPGLVRMAVRLRSPQRPDLADELIAAAWHHITRIQRGGLNCHTADYILRSARRDVFFRPSHQRREVLLLSTDVPIEDRLPTASTVDPPNEASESLAASILDGAHEDGRITASARTIVWLRDVLGLDMATTAAAAGRAPSSAYRIRQQAHRSLRLFLADGHRVGTVAEQKPVAVP